MPEICRFYGIVIRMFFDDHNPPHFHAIYGEHEVVIGIQSLAVLRGRLPARARDWSSSGLLCAPTNYLTFGNERGLHNPCTELSLCLDGRA